MDAKKIIADLDVPKVSIFPGLTQADGSIILEKPTEMHIIKNLQRFLILRSCLN